MRIGLLFSVIALCVAGHAQAYCIVNRSNEPVAYSRGGPVAGMEQFYAGTVAPGAQVCVNITPRSDGTFPVSIYSVTKRGNCAVVQGCFYETRAEQVFYRGAASQSCPLAFQDNACS